MPVSILQMEDEDEDHFFLSLLLGYPAAVAVEPTAYDLDGASGGGEIWDMDLGEMAQQTIAWLPGPDDPYPSRDGQVGGALEEHEIFTVSGSRQLQPQQAFNGRLTEYATEYDIHHNLANIADITSIAPVVDNFINHLVQPLIANADDDDFIALTIDSATLEKPLNVSYHKRNTFDPRSFLNAIFKKAQSSGALFLFDGKIKLGVSVMKPISGSGTNRTLKTSMTSDSFFTRKRDLIQIKNNDHRCGYLAITIGYIYDKKQHHEIPLTSRQWRNYMMANSRVLRERMERLFRELNVSTATPLDLEKVREIQSKLPNYQLIVMERPKPVKVLEKSLQPSVCRTSERQADNTRVRSRSASLQLHQKADWVLEQSTVLLQLHDRHRTRSSVSTKLQTVPITSCTSKQQRHLLSRLL